MPSTTPRRDPHSLILWLNDYRKRRLRWSICALAREMTRTGHPMQCRTLTNVFTHADERAAGRASKRSLPRDVAIQVIVDYCEYLRVNAKRRTARAAAKAETTANV